MDDKIISALLSALIKKADATEGCSITKMDEWEDSPADKLVDKLTGAKEDSPEDDLVDALGGKLAEHEIEDAEDEEEEEDKGDIKSILKLFA